MRALRGSFLLKFFIYLYLFQKHKLVNQGADPTKTEYEIMTQRGFMRIWDCGNLRYRWKK